MASPQDQEEWFEEGNTRFGLPRYEEAIQDYEQLIRLDPTSGLAYYNKSTARYNLQCHEEAEKAYQEAQKLWYIYTF